MSECGGGPSDPPAAVAVDRTENRRTGIGSRLALRLLAVDPEIQRGKFAGTGFRLGGRLPPIPQEEFPVHCR